jgi:hypothetical protein
MGSTRVCESSALDRRETRGEKRDLERENTREEEGRERTHALIGANGVRR